MGPGGAMRQNRINMIAAGMKMKSVVTSNSIQLTSTLAGGTHYKNLANPSPCLIRPIYAV